MHAGLAWFIAAQIAGPTDPGPSQWGVDGTTTVRGVDALTNHVVIRVSEWCRYVDDPEVWQAGDEFHGEPEEPPTVGENEYRCEYEIVQDGATFEGAPWDAPNARDDVFYALPRAKFPIVDERIPKLDKMSVKSFYPRLESGWSGALRAATGSSRGIAVPSDSSLIGFADEVRAELRDGVFALIPERRTWRFHDKREVMTPPDEGPPPAPPAQDPPPAVAPPPTAKPDSLAEDPPPIVPLPTAKSDSLTEDPPPVVPQPTPEPAPMLPPDGDPPLVAASARNQTSPAAEPATPLVRTLGIGGVCLVLGFLVGLALRRPR